MISGDTLSVDYVLLGVRPSELLLSPFSSPVNVLFQKLLEMTHSFYFVLCMCATKCKVQRKMTNNLYNKAMDYLY